MEKFDYKKACKSLYLPKQSPGIIEVPAMTFAVLEGEGDPNGEGFAGKTQALYGFSYAVKMSGKKGEAPEGFYDYVVFPLEGEWDLIDKAKGAGDKSNFKYRLMIRQPDFVTRQVFGTFLDKVSKKKPNPAYSDMRLETIEEGFCCQMLHVGPYETEPESFGRMEAFCAESGWERASKRHREIYLSDPRKTSPEKLKTVLRFTVRRIG